MFYKCWGLGPLLPNFRESNVNGVYWTCTVVALVRDTMLYKHTKFLPLRIKSLGVEEVKQNH